MGHDAALEDFLETQAARRSRRALPEYATSASPVRDALTIGFHGMLRFRREAGFGQDLPESSRSICRRMPATNRSRASSSTRNSGCSRAVTKRGLRLNQ